MEKLKDTDLYQIKGGFTITPAALLAIAGIIVFLSGVIEGITNPDKCRS